MTTFRVRQYINGTPLDEVSNDAESAQTAAEAVCGESLIEAQGGVLRAQVTLVENGRVSRRMFYKPPRNL